jgi:UTP--glucose-1-phosphate uridylyltransferase
MKAKKAVITAGGLGLNLLPATKALPKEILPIFDRPVIDYVVQELKESGITDILLVSGKRKRAIEDYFDSAPALEMALEEKHKTALIQLIQASTDVNLYFTKQSEPTGIGDALLLAEDFVDNDPFVLVLSDDIVKDPVPLTKLLLQDFDAYQAPVLGIENITPNEIRRYGVVELGAQKTEGLAAVKQIVEKPDENTAPSKLGVIGRYVLPGDFFNYLRQLPKQTPDTEQLSTALNLLNQDQPILARYFHGQREDISTKLGLLKASIDYGLKSPEFGPAINQYIKDLVSSGRLD